MAAPPPARRIRWKASYRIIPSRFPTVGLFDRVARPADLDAVFEIEARTNPRLRDEIGQISLVPPNRRISGAGTTPVMAAFCHPNSAGSRFSPGDYGVYYAAHHEQTAIAETVYHRERFLRRTQEPAARIEMRCYAAAIDATLDDIREGFPQLLYPDSYTASQAFGVARRQVKSDGIIYPSVRHAGGTCVALFYPDLVRPPVRVHTHYLYDWDGTRIAHVIRAEAVAR